MFGSKEKHSSRNRAVEKLDWNLTTENSDIWGNNVFIQKKVKAFIFNSLDKSKIETFVTHGRSEIADMEKGGEGCVQEST